MNLLSFDIEDNFTAEELCHPSDLPKYEEQVVWNTKAVLELLRLKKATATFFVVGKVAKRHPGLIKMIADAGHEIASHGFLHERIAALGKNGFREDLLLSKHEIETLYGRPVKGYRAMGFSLTADMAWALSVLADEGFCYDSSILGTHYRNHQDCFTSYLRNGLTEIPVPDVAILGRRVPVGGGVAFRLAPLPIIRRMIKNANKMDRPFLIYAHAWEFNKDQPKRKVSRLQALAQSPATFTTPERLAALLDEFPFTSIENYICPNGAGQ